MTTTLFPTTTSTTSILPTTTTSILPTTTTTSILPSTTTTTTTATTTTDLPCNKEIDDYYAALERNLAERIKANLKNIASIQDDLAELALGGYTKLTKIKRPFFLPKRITDPFPKISIIKQSFCKGDKVVFTEGYLNTSTWDDLTITYERIKNKTSADYEIMRKSNDIAYKILKNQLNDLYEEYNIKKGTSLYDILTVTTAYFIGPFRSTEHYEDVSYNPLRYRVSLNPKKLPNEFFVKFADLNNRMVLNNSLGDFINGLHNISGNEVSIANLQLFKEYYEDIKPKYKSYEESLKNELQNERDIYLQGNLTDFAQNRKDKLQERMFCCRNSFQKSLFTLTVPSNKCAEFEYSEEFQSYVKCDPKKDKESFACQKYKQFVQTECSIFIRNQKKIIELDNFNASIPTVTSNGLCEKAANYVLKSS